MNLNIEEKIKKYGSKKSSCQKALIDDVVEYTTDHIEWPDILGDCDIRHPTIRYKWDRVDMTFGADSYADDFGPMMKSLVNTYVTLVVRRLSDDEKYKLGL